MKCLTCMSTAHLKKFLDELELQDDMTNHIALPVPIMIESRSPVDMGVSYQDTKHTQHIMRCYHYIHEEVVNKQHELIWLPMESQLADIGTKPFAPSKFEPLMNYIMVKVKEE